MQRKKKKDNPKLVKKLIINKEGKRQTVYVDPNETVSDIHKRLFANPITRKKEEEKVVLGKGGKVYLNPDTYEGLQEKYSKKPISWKVMTDVKWENLKKGKKINLTNKEWKQLLQENDKMIHFIAKKYSFGEVYGDRYQELKSVGQSAFVEAANKYERVFNKKKPFDFTKFAYVYVHGRIKESVANRLDAGLRVPKGLQKPYQEFIDIKNKLQIKLGAKPSREAIAKELQKIWTKQTFYSQYATTEGRSMGQMFVVKDKKTGKVLYEGDDLKKAKKKYVKGKSDIIRREKGFTDLSPEQQKKVRKEDQLPLEGWITVNKTGVVKDKETKHEENLSKIEDDFQQRAENLEATYLSTNNMDSKDRFEAKKIIDELQRRVNVTQENIKQAKQEKIDSIIITEAEINSAKQNVEKYQSKPKSKDYKNAVKNLSNVNSDRYRDQRVADINEKLKTLRETEERQIVELRMSKQLFEPMTEKTYEERKKELERLKEQQLNEERKRHNKDTSSTYIPGIIQRIKEFEQIEAIKEQPLNLYIDDNEGDSKSNLEVTFTPDELSAEEKMTLLQEHEIGKQVIKDNLNLLVPVYKDIMSMRMGLHEKSEPTVDNLWGELATVKEIINHLDKKHKTILGNEDKFLNLVNKKLNNDTDRFLMLKTVPFVVERYFYNPELIKKDYDSWQNSKPKVGKKVKVKIKTATYNKLYNTYRSNIKRAKTQWNNWKSKNKKYDQKTSTKVYNMLKKKYKATEEFKPKRFVLATTKKIDPKKLNAWEQRKPQIFANSYSNKEKYVLNAIKDSTDILRHTVPLISVRNLLSAHRRLIEAGIVAEKAVNEQFGNLKNFIIKSFGEMKIC